MMFTSNTMGLPGITGLKIEGFKSHSTGSSIVIRPLTILAGANSSGKSSAIQPLLLLKQTLEASYDPGSLLLSGPNVRFTASDQLLTKHRAKSQPEEFSVTISFGSVEAVKATYRKSDSQGLTVAETEYQLPFDGRAITLRQNMSGEEIGRLLPPPLISLADRINASPGSQLTWTVIRNRCLLVLALQIETKGVAPYLSPAFSPLFDSPEREIRGVIHVPGRRGNPERTYPTTPGVATDYPGTFENYVASIIRSWQLNAGDRLANLGFDLERLGLTWKIEAHPVDDTQVELRVGRMPKSTRGSTRDLVSIADVGFGVSQVIPVLVALSAAEPGQLVFVEQPEIHLHPRAQIAMAEVLSNAAKRGVHVVVETHSSTLILALQALVAEGYLSPELTKLHWFRRRSDGSTAISSSELDKSGAYGNWPEDFGDVELDLQRRYLVAAGRHQRIGA